MKKMLGLITLSLLMLASNVYATGYDNGSNGGEDSHQSHNHDSNDDNGNSGNSNYGGNSGQGGQGGTGGAAYSGAVGIGAALSGANSYSGASVSGTNSNTSGSSASIGRVVNQGSTYNQVHQVPFAYAPSTNVGSGKYRCNDGASLGLSSGFGAISGGMPVTDELCQQLVMADWLADHNLSQEACEMMLLDPRVQEVFKKTGRTCAPAVVTPVQSIYVAPKFVDPDQQYKLDSIFKSRIGK